MRPPQQKTFAMFLTAALIFSVFFGSQTAGAADGADHWRKTYDLVLMWINFGIFVFLIVKFLRIPLKKFIAGKQSELERKISRLEEEKNEADKKIQDILQAVDQSRIEFDVLKQKILEQGERRKAEVIKDARRMSRVMLEGAQHRVESQIRRARRKLRNELVDAAVDLALQKLPRMVTEDDNRKLVQEYIAGAKGK